MSRERGKLLPKAEKVQPSACMRYFVDPKQYRQNGDLVPVTEPEEYEGEVDPFTPESAQMPIEDPKRIMRRREIMRVKREEKAKETDVRTPTLAEIEQFHTDVEPVQLPDLAEHKSSAMPTDKRLEPILAAAQQLIMLTSANIRQDIESYFAEAKQRFGDKANNGSELERLAANMVLPVLDMIRIDVLELMEKSA